MKPLSLTYLSPIKAINKNQQPYSSLFDDVYFNDIGGLAESRYVFIQQNGLLERWQQASTDHQFCIAETGFGTGLNFMAVCQAWQTAKTRPKHLHFISFEKHPLDSKSLQQAHQCFAELAPFSIPLLTAWGNFRSGFQRIEFADNVTLTLVLGDAFSYLSQLRAHVDAWFLDGFAPNKNPAMWQTGLFNEINRLSKPGTTLATFTAASAISKNLAQHGFTVKKRTGFGKKREMITASFDHSVQTTGTNHPWDPLPKAQISQNKVTILGAGIAGLCMAQKFKLAGFEVTMVEQHSQPMQAASGNTLAMVMPLLTAQDTPESLFYVRAFEAAKKFYHADELHVTGVQQTWPQNKPTKWAKQMAQAGLPESLVTIQADAALYPQAGYVDTKQVSNRLSASVDQWLHLHVSSIQQSTTGQWQLLDQKTKLAHQCELLIVANGIQAQHLLAQMDLSLIAKHGQTSTVIPPTETKLSQILLHDGYVIPHAEKDLWLCGATFDHATAKESSLPAQLADNHWQRNLQLWEHHDFHHTLSQATVESGYAAIRATTPDHLPMCGPLIDQTIFKIEYQDLHHGRHWQNYPAAQCLGNLYMLNGLGSRGFTSAPLLAQYLTAMILAEPLPLEADLCKIIHPNRFLYRNLKKPPKHRKD